MNFTSRFLTSATLNLLEQGVRIASVFIMTPLIVGSLGVNMYGYWALLMSVFQHYSLLDFGLSTSISRFFARALGQENEEKLNVSFNTAFQISVCVTAVAFLVSGVIYLVCPIFMEGNTSMPTIRAIIALYGSYLSIGFMTRVFRSLLKSQLRYDIVVFASITQILIGNTLIFFALKQGHGILALAILNVAAGLIEYGIVILSALVITPGVRINLKFADALHRRKMLGFSASSFVISLANLLRYTADPIILASFVGASSVSYYNIGSRFAHYFSDLVTAVTGSQILVILSRFHGAGEYQRMREKFHQATRFCVVIAVTGGFSMMLYGPRFIERWMGPGFEPSQEILLILAVPFTLSLMQFPSIGLLNAMAKHAQLAVLLISGGIFNIVLSLILTQFLGLYGVVWATCIEMIIVFLIILPQVLCRAANIAYTTYFFRTLAVPAGKTLLALSPSLLILNYLQPTYASLLGFATLQMLYLAPLVFWFVLGGTDRNALIRALRPLISRRHGG